MPLEYRPGLGRVTRVEPWDQLSIPTKERIKEALRRGDRAEALALLEYLDRAEAHIVADHYPIQIETQLTAVADLFDEGRVETILRKIARTMDSPVRTLASKLPVEQLVYYHAEFKRSQFAELDLREEPDRYVMTFTKCMPGGEMRTTRTSDGRLPRHLGRTTHPYGWSWSRAGVLYYCALQCVAAEIVPIEERGYPDYVTECAHEDGGVCRRYYYKRPELIPAEYYERVGKKKPGT